MSLIMWNRNAVCVKLNGHILFKEYVVRYKNHNHHIMAIFDDISLEDSDVESK